MKIKLRTAVLLRRLAGQQSRLPDWAWAAAQRLAFKLAPHSLTCRTCGRRFVQPRPASMRHVDAAFEHSEEHWAAEQASDRENGDRL